MMNTNLSQKIITRLWIFSFAITIGLGFTLFMQQKVYASTQSVAESTIGQTFVLSDVQPSITTTILASPTVGITPLNVQFDIEATDTISNWAWSFGDGVTSSLPHPSHTYTVPNIYTVTLTINSPSGYQSYTKTNYITVSQPLSITTITTPTAHFHATPTVGIAPLRVQWRDQSDGEVTDWLWTFGNGITSTMQHPSYTYTLPGIYTATLNVSGPGGSHTQSKTNYITVSHPSPITSFTATPLTGIAPLPIQFNDQSSGDITNWLWMFGNGITSTLQSPLHTYTAPGIYTVTLNTSGLGGSHTQVMSNYITVSHSSPIAHFTATALTGTTPFTVQFSDQSSGDITNWLWDLGNGITTTAQHPSHTYTLSGTYPISLMVIGPGGNDITIQSITVSQPRPITITTTPTAFFSASPITGTVPLTVQFSDQSSGDITNWLWDLGNGITTTAQHPSHTYSSPGLYTITLAVSNLTSSHIYIASNYITVTAATMISPTSTTTVTTVSTPTNPLISPTTTVTITTIPTASFTASPITGTAPLTVSFMDRSNGEITSWRWAFGDGITSTQQNPSHLYMRAGVYTTTLIVSNTVGADAITKTAYITVFQPSVPLSETVQIPVAAFTATTLTGAAPLQLQFIDQSAGEIDNWLWSFGDGITSTLSNPFYTYTATGVYTVSLTISNSSGHHSQIITNFITVNQPTFPPIALFTASSITGTAPLEVQFQNQSNGNVSQYTWSFGDGITSTIANPVYTYTVAAVYTVTLHAIGPGGSNTLVHSHYITVSDLVPIESQADAAAPLLINLDNDLPTIMVGDVNCDQRSDIQDAMLTFQFNVKRIGAVNQCPESSLTNAVYQPACDVNRDGLCNSTDALFMMQCIDNIQNSLCRDIGSRAVQVDEHLPVSQYGETLIFNEQIFLPIVHP